MKNALISLIKNASFLSSVVKKQLIAQCESANEKEIDALTKLVLDAKQEAKDIDQTHQTNKQNILRYYLKKIKIDAVEAKKYLLRSIEEKTEQGNNPEEMLLRAINKL